MGWIIINLPITHSSVTWPSALQPTPRQVELGAPLVPHGSVSLLHGSPAGARQPGLSSAAGQLLQDLEASSRSAAAARGEGVRQEVRCAERAAGQAAAARRSCLGGLMPRGAELLTPLASCVSTPASAGSEEALARGPPTLTFLRRPQRPTQAAQRQQSREGAHSVACHGLHTPISRQGAERLFCRALQSPRAPSRFCGGDAWKQLGRLGAPVSARYPAAAARPQHAREPFSVAQEMGHSSCLGLGFDWLHSFHRLEMPFQGSGRSSVTAERASTPAMHPRLVPNTETSHCWCTHTLVAALAFLPEV